MAGELLEVPGGGYGMVLNLEEDNVGCAILGSDVGIGEGDTVKRTGKIVEVPVGPALVGRVVNALGEPVDGAGELTGTCTGGGTSGSVPIPSAPAATPQAWYV